MAPPYQLLSAAVLMVICDVPQNLPHGLLAALPDGDSQGEVVAQVRVHSLAVATISMMANKVPT